jgi:hypothetical protein
VVAFVASLLILGLLVALVFPFAKRRPVGTPLSWGEAMVASTYAFLAMFWAYGVIPHLFLTWADNELKWRPDKIVNGPADILQPSVDGGWLPMTITYQTVRDLLVVGLYIAFLAGQIALWAYWQGRGAKKSATDLVTSDFGRPLVKKA